MKNFIIRASSLAVIVLMLFGYNEVLNVRAKDEQIAKLQASLDEDTANTGQSQNSIQMVLMKEKEPDLVDQSM